MKLFALASVISLLALATPPVAHATDQGQVCKTQLVPDKSGRSYVWGRVCWTRAEWDARMAREAQEQRLRYNDIMRNSSRGPDPDGQLPPTAYTQPIPAYVAPAPASAPR